jgi:hypothetical protein
MSVSADQIQLTPYGPDRFPRPSMFGPIGYLFTVPGSFPEDTPAHLDVTDWEVAVYRVHEGWEARDVNGPRKVWGTGSRRRDAIGWTFDYIGRTRRAAAANNAEQRANLRLEPVPPYVVELKDDGDQVAAVIHARCGCKPDAAGYHENEPDAVDHAREAAPQAWTTCPKSPSP